MKNFFLQIIKKIKKLDDFTSQYQKLSNNIEIPSLAYTNWGMHFAQLKDFDSAIEKLETAVLMTYQNPKPCISLGIIYSKLKEYDKAEKFLKKAIEMDTQNAYPYSVLGSIYVSQNKFDEADEILKKANKLAPTESEIYLNFGILYAKQQKRNKAVEMLKKAKFYNVSNAHIYFLLGVMYFETDRISEAFVEFEALKKLSPKYKNLNYYLSLCYKKEKNYMAVMEYAHRALDDDKENAQIYILLAQNYALMGKKEACFKIYQLGFERGINTSEFLLAWGISFLNENLLDEAKEKFNKILEKDDKSALALSGLGQCFFKEKDYDEANKYFDTALEINPENITALSTKGLIEYNQKNYDAAIKLLLDTVNISADEKHLYFYIANCYYKLNKYKKSSEYYEKTLEYYPNHLEALINYCVILLNSNNEKEAMRKIRKAYQINRESEKVLLIYALCSFKIGMYNEAIEKADLILQNNENNIDAKIIKCHALIGKQKANETLNIIFSLPEDIQQYDIFTYLTYCAYKILVENEPSNYNESMLNLYEEKLEKIKESTSNSSQVSEYLTSTININKG